MLAKRIIAALDIKAGKVVKGIQFENLVEVGDPLVQGKIYETQGIDEIVFLDITASSQGRSHTIELMSKVARTIRIPFTVGGGIHSVDEMVRLIAAGADKVFVNTAAVLKPELVKEGADVIGGANLVVAVDAKLMDGQWQVLIRGGKEKTDWSLVEWCQYVEQLGAGELLLTSMDCDGTQQGFDIPMLQAVTEKVGIPVIASGGAGKMEDFAQVFQQTGVSGALAASVFHYGSIGVKELKSFLKGGGVHVRGDGICEVG